MWKKRHSQQCLILNAPLQGTQIQIIPVGIQLLILCLTIINTVKFNNKAINNRFTDSEYHWGGTIQSGFDISFDNFTSSVIELALIPLTVQNGKDPGNVKYAGLALEISCKCSSNPTVFHHFCKLWSTFMACLHRNHCLEKLPDLEMVGHGWGGCTNSGGSYLIISELINLPFCWCVSNSFKKADYCQIWLLITKSIEVWYTAFVTRLLLGIISWFTTINLAQLFSSFDCYLATSFNQNGNERELVEDQPQDNKLESSLSEQIFLK